MTLPPPYVVSSASWPRRRNQYTISSNGTVVQNLGYWFSPQPPFLTGFISSVSYLSLIITKMDSLTRTLPASWFCSSALYQLERRSVFLNVGQIFFMGLNVANSLKSWHLLGPVTRFQGRNTPVVYEIAQVTIIVANQSPESKGVNRDDIVVYTQDEVCFTNARNRKY